MGRAHDASLASIPWERSAQQVLRTLDGWIPVVTAAVGQQALDRGDIAVLFTVLSDACLTAPDLVVQWIASTAGEGQAFLVYLAGLVDGSRLTDGLAGQTDAGKALRQSGMAIQDLSTWADLVQAYLAGNVVVIGSASATAFQVDLNNPPHRDVTQPTLERSIRGPQEAFVEPLEIQVGQLRQRLQTAALRIQSVSIGSRIPTACAIAYLADLASPRLVATVQARVKAVDLDAVTNATRLGSVIRDSSWAFFPTVRYTERVDLAALAMEQGKVAILVNGDPSVITVPATLADFYRTSEDYSTVWYDASFIRLIRWLALGFGVFLPGLYIALTEVNPDLISPTLFDLVAGSHSGLPFTPFVEVVVMILAIEILREAALRLPKGLGSTIGTVGAIVVGTAVVKAGFVSPQIIVVMTLTALSLFSVPTYDLLASWRLISWVMLMAAFVLGIYGMVIVTLWLSMTMIDLQSFGTPYMAPVAPWRPKDWGNYLWRVPWSALTRRLTESQAVPLRWLARR